MFSTFEYSLAFISIMLIITIIVIIFYKKTEDEDNDDTITSSNMFSNVDSNKDTYLKVNMDMNMNMDMDMDMDKNIEHFYEGNYDQASIDTINANNSNISDLINSINALSKNNPSLNMKYRKIDIDNILQENIADYLTEKTNDLLDRVDTSNVRINSKINTLTNQIDDLENTINKLQLKNIIKQNYSKIKSLNNGAEMTLTQTPKTVFVDPSSGVNTPAYMVNLNNGCLSVGATDYDVYKCNDTNTKHLFKMEHVINETAYQTNIDKSLPFNNIDTSTVNYPFVLMKSINNKNCLTNQNGNITIQPCDTLTAQRWLPI
jgi:hypothetical protein